MWGLDVGLPEVISSSGGKFLWNDCKETPEVLTSTYHYPKEKKIIEFEVRPWMTNKEDGVEVGNIFYGDKGYMVINGYNDYKTFLGKNREPGPARNAGGDHYKNFVEAVRATGTVANPIAKGADRAATEGGWVGSGELVAVG